MMEKYGRKKYKAAGNAILNKPGKHSIAALSWRVDASSTVCIDSDKEITASGGILNASFTVSDCMKVVNIDLDSRSKSDYENSLHKIDVMVEELRKLREHLIKARAVFRIHKRFKKKGEGKKVPWKEIKRKLEERNNKDKNDKTKNTPAVSDSITNAAPKH